MNDLDQAALILAGFTAIFLLAAFAMWRARHPRTEPAAPRMPKAPREPGESRFSGFARKAEVAIEPVEIAPARLARISRAAVERPVEPAPAYEPAPEAGAAIPEPVLVEAAPVDEPGRPEPDAAAFAEPPAFDESVLDALASEVERNARTFDASEPRRDAVRLVPQIPPRDAILRTSWMGGRPRLPASAEWPTIDGREGDFVAQIACADLPPTLWGGLGPRTGWLAYFTNPDTGAVTAVHLAEDGAPRDPPRAVGPAYFRPYGIAAADPAAPAIAAFPEWPVDIVAGQPDLPETGRADGMLAADYDIADPAFHPFDWPSMLALARILEERVIGPAVESAPVDASDELVQALETAVEANREAAERTAEIVTIIRESAAADTGFLPSDATAVMAALHAIGWTQVSARPDPESGEDEVETLTLPLTRHRPDGDLWVDDYRAVLFDYAKHAWCADPGRLSAPARAFFEPLWEAMATNGIASIGDFPTHHVPGFDEERDAVMLELAPSRLLGFSHRSGGHLVFAIRKADLAAGDFSTMRALADG